MKIGEIIEFPARQWTTYDDSSPTKVVKLPIKIKDLETNEILEFDYFIWDDQTGAIPTSPKSPTKISYDVEDRVGYRVLRFKVFYR